MDFPGAEQASSFKMQDSNVWFPLKKKIKYVWTILKCAADKHLAKSL